MLHDAQTAFDRGRKLDDLDWPTPDMTILNAGRHPAPVLPMEPFGPWTGWLRAHAEGRSVPVDYVAARLLVTVSTMIGNSRWASPWPGWQEPPHLWLALIGNPSAGKSPGLDATLNLLRTLQLELAAGFDERFREYDRDREAANAAKDVWLSEVKAAVKKGVPPPDMPESSVVPEMPVRPRLYVSDPTVEAMGRLLASHPRGLLFYRDELGGWPANFDRYGGGGDRAFWSESFGGRPYIIDRVKLGREPICIPHLSIGVTGGIQPDRLARLLMSGDDDGLASRLLMTWPESVPPRRPKSVVDDAPAIAAFRRLLGLSMAEDEVGNPRPVVIRFSDEVAALFQEWREANAVHGPEASGLYLSHLGKLPGIVVRLALVLHHLRWSFAKDKSEPGTITADAVGYAAHFIDDYFKPMAKRAYGDAALPTAERGAATIAHIVVKERFATVNASALRQRTLPDLRNAEKVEPALQVVCEAGWLYPDPSRKGGNQGRQKSDYRVNPFVQEATQ